MPRNRYLFKIIENYEKVNEINKGSIGKVGFERSISFTLIFSSRQLLDNASENDK